MPEVNAMLTANGVQQLSAIDISVAVATDAGLITPIVKDAVNLRVEEISANVKVCNILSCIIVEKMGPLNL